MTKFDHTSIANGMKCIPLPTRKRGAQSAEAKEEYERALSEWCREIIQTAEKMDFKIGARDWCYVLENAGSLTKGQFDAAERLIGDCRKDGHLPLDICAIDKGRPTANVESIDNTSVKEEAEDIVERIKDAHLAYEPFSFWENQENYVESAVEKIGLFNLFEEPTEEFHVPLTNLGGWSDINSRAEMMRRFAYWERRGKRCVLLACNDHDPGGFNISDFIKSNLNDLKGAVGWSPENLKVDRFGLNTRFIDRYRLSWIENLETASGDDLGINVSDHKPYVQDYIKQFGARKVEANALVVRPEAGRALCRQAILKYVSQSAVDAYDRRLSVEQRKVQAAVRRLLSAPLNDVRSAFEPGPVMTKNVPP